MICKIKRLANELQVFRVHGRAISDSTINFKHGSEI